MAKNAKFEDKGFLGPNDYAKNDKHPTHKGKVTLSRATLKELLRRYEDGEDVSLDLSAWRQTDDPKRFNISIGPAYQKGESNSRGGERSKGSFRRDDEDEPRPRDRDRDDARDRFANGGDRDERKRGRLTEDMDDEIPFNERRSQSRGRREYGNEGDL